MPPKRRRKIHGLYFHSSPPKGKNYRTHFYMLKYAHLIFLQRPVIVLIGRTDSKLASFLL